MRVIIAGGGTGGHLFPAVAVGEEILRECPTAEVLHAGASNGMEAKWFPANGIPHELFPVRGFTGKSPLTRARALGEFVSAVSRGRSLLARFGADLVLSAGGYASAPMAVAAIGARIPLVLMEQNTRPGLANRMLWRFACKICVGFEETAAAFASGKAVVTGNPVRLKFVPEPLTDVRSPLQILVLGGSSGAHRLNLEVLNAFNIRGKDVIKLRVTHQTGEADVGLVSEAYKDLGGEGRVLSFIDDMADALSRADLVIARAGAMTVSEIALSGRPAIFVPYPFHSDRQQELNARVLVRRGGAKIIFDDENLGANLAAELERLTSNPALMLEMGRRAREASLPDAAQKIARICFDIFKAERRPA
jgi:UDP-N-acetylglucosamine--N-acetylmuramyl-(pentapeptide) pyrophosphoryl-undecaprenol N-acetylglucosamine transferase